MSEKYFERQVESLEKLASDSEAQQELGSRLVKEVAKAVLAEQRGEEIDDPDVKLAFRKGGMPSTPRPIPHQRARISSAWGCQRRRMRRCGTKSNIRGYGPKLRE